MYYNYKKVSNTVSDFGMIFQTQNISILVLPLTQMKMYQQLHQLKLWRYRRFKTIRS